LTLENDKAKPRGYAVKKNLSATFAGKNMIWTGSIIGVFLVYHLLHFTVQVTNPEISAGRNLDAAGRPDVFHMLVLSFQRAFIASIYVGAMIALALHLVHGIQSFFQTLGLNNDRTFPVIIKSGTFAAVIIFLGYIAIPIIILVGILKG
jgi:succinate dehydrogenase / fumarate reductase cytochrome b subunit